MIQFDGVSNPWRPDTGNVRGGYFLRPMDGDGRPVIWRDTHTALRPGTPPVTDETVDNNNPQARPWGPYPKLSKLKSRALAADIFATPHRIAWRHKKGINVLNANGSAKWFDRGSFGTGKLPTTWVLPFGANPAWSTTVVDFEKLPQPFPTPSSQYNGTIASIWELLDRDGGAKPSERFDFPQ